MTPWYLTLGLFLCPQDWEKPYHGIFPVLGERPLLVILLGGKGHPPPSTQLAPLRSPEEFRKILFGGEKSVRGYFTEASYGHFTFREAFVTKWLEPTDDPSTGQVDESTWEFIQGLDLGTKGAWVLQQVEKLTPFRFSNYDQDKDGVVTQHELGVLWIYPGDGGARGRATNPGTVAVPSLSKGVKLGYLVRGGNGMSMTTMAHELAHQVLGLVDLYGGNGKPSLVGGFSLMCAPVEGTHLDPWAKMKLGWLKPTVVTQDGWTHVKDVETHAEVFLLHDPAHGPQEYFLIENRWPGGSYESKLRDRGLAVWHIHEGRWGGDWGRKSIRLVMAGGAPPQPAAKRLWDGSDPETGYDLTPTSTPSALRWEDGTSSEIGIWGISQAGPEVGVFFDVPPLRSTPPDSESASNR
jgi:M6 family metalloprotease-like protein